jgi:uncharacterized protein YdaU (DUF1376 family)
MKPDIYMPFYWFDFWQAVKGWPYPAIVGYQKALTHYWFHENCDGLKNDSGFLRKICELDKEEWTECMELIFDNRKFFVLDKRTKLWKQKRADEEWAKAIKTFERKSYGGKYTAAKRWGNIPPPK